MTTDYIPLATSSHHQRQSSIHIKQLQHSQHQQKWLKKMNLSIQNQKRLIITVISISSLILLAWFLIPTQSYAIHYNSNEGNRIAIDKPN